MKAYYIDKAKVVFKKGRRYLIKVTKEEVTKQSSKVMSKIEVTFVRPLFRGNEEKQLNMLVEDLQLQDYSISMNDLTRCIKEAS